MNNRKKRFVAAILMLAVVFSCFTGVASAAEAAISLSAGTGGTLSVVIKEGDATLWDSGSVSGEASKSITFTTGYDITVTAAANSGYSVSSITVGGTAYTGTNTVTLTGQTAASLEISANFAVSVTNYSLATQVVTDGTVTPTGGTVTAGGSYAGGATVSLTATPASGYYFSGWSCDSGSFSSSSDKTTTFTMPAANCTVSANFKKLVKHKLTLGSPDHGKLSIGGGYDNSMTTTVSGEYYAGDVIRLVSEADKGYILNYWFTDGSGTLDSRYYYATDFVMPDTDVTVSAVFVKSESGSEKEDKPSSGSTSTTPGTTPDTPATETPNADTLYIISTEASTGGSVVVSESTAKSGGTVTVTATANEGYTFSGWVSTAGGTFADQKALTTTFTMPAADTTIVATFVAEQNTGATVHPTDDDKDDDHGSGKKGFPWLWVGIGAAAVALIVGIIAVLIDRKNKDDGYYDEPEEESYAMTARTPRKERKKFFKKRENRFTPDEDEDPTYNDAFFDDF